VGAKDYKFRHLTLDLLPPNVGERITAFGYHDNEVTAAEKQIALRQRARRLTDRYWRSITSFVTQGSCDSPAFGTNARFEGRNERRPCVQLVRPVVRAGLFRASAIYPRRRTYVVCSGLVAAMAIPIDLNRVGYPPDVRYTVFDLVRDNFLVTKNSDRVLVDDLDETGTARISLRVP